jgi:hypothetical protein
MKPCRAVTCWTLLVALGAVTLGAAPPDGHGVQPDDLRRWLTYLAGDELEGRATFSEGLGLAAAYLAEQLRSFGVQPGGDNGTYFQRVRVLGVKSVNRSTLTVTVGGRTRVFKDGEGLSFPRNVGGKRRLELDQVEFLGYGLPRFGRPGQEPEPRAEADAPAPIASPATPPPAAPASPPVFGPAALPAPPPTSRPCNASTSPCRPS